MGYRKWSVEGSPSGARKESVVPLSDAGTESFDSNGSLPQPAAVLKPVAGAWAVSPQWDLFPLAVALTSLRISTNEVRSIKALSFPH